MAAKVLDHLAGDDDEDEEICVLYSTPITLKRAATESNDISIIYATPFSASAKGATKSDPISVETYRRLKPKPVIDLSKGDEDDVKFLYFRERVPIGDCSYAKSAIDMNPLTFICEICTCKKLQSYEFRVLGCDHSYCSDCVVKYVSSKLQDSVIDIQCPVSGCKGFLEPNHCRSILPKQVFDRWGDALCEAVISASQKFYCPFKDCSALLVDDLNGECGVIDQCVCPECNRLFCAQCKVPWHAGMECSDFERLNKDERSSDDIMLINLAKNKKWQRCRDCRFYVERSEGCLLMTCRCGYSFCYNCCAPMKEHYCDNCKH